jgi:hypothetical protein
MLTHYFACHPDASCPVFGDPDVSPTAENPVAKAIAEGIRYEDRFAETYGLDARELAMGSSNDRDE